MLTKKEAYTVAVVGATGAVGRELLEVLGARKFPVGQLRLFASARSAGTVLDCLGRQTTVETLGARAFAGVDLVFISVNEEESRRWAPVAVAAGAVVIDDSAAFRLDPQVPLVVPEVNGDHYVSLKQKPAHSQNAQGPRTRHLPVERRSLP